MAAGLGGGSSDAAAALRLLARANGIALDDPRLIAAARETGADVPVCLDPRPRMMRGIGEILSEPLALPKLPAVLVNPGVAVPTRDVFAALACAGRWQRNGAKRGIAANSHALTAGRLIELLAGASATISKRPRSRFSR